MSRRRLPPLVSERDRFAAAALQVDRLLAYVRRRSPWVLHGTQPEWGNLAHHATSAGAIHSQDPVDAMTEIHVLERVKHWSRGGDPKRPTLWRGLLECEHPVEWMPPSGIEPPATYSALPTSMRCEACETVAREELAKPHA